MSREHTHGRSGTDSASERPSPRRSAVAAPKQGSFGWLHADATPRWIQFFFFSKVISIFYRCPLSYIVCSATHGTLIEVMNGALLSHCHTLP